MTEWTVRKYEELRFQQGRSNKFYRVIVLETVDEARLVTQWGRIGTEGQHRVEVFDDTLTACMAFDDKAEEKARKGYFRVTNSPGECDLDHALSMAAITVSPGLRLRAGETRPAFEAPAPASVTVLDKAAELLAEATDGDRQVSVDEMMDKFAALVEEADTLQSQTAEAKAALDMALAAVMRRA